MSDGPDDSAIIPTIADELPVGVWVARAPGGEFIYANARDAMPDGGRFAVHTYDAILGDDEVRRRPPLRPGPHVVLEVSDTGAGIDPAIRERIFEPYFTTKTDGEVRGNGLGLATVYGIVQSHGGAIEVADGEARGTTMRLFFPALSGSERPAAGAAGTRGGVEHGRGTVLLVDDEPLVRAATRRALQALGYDVLGAADGVEAVDLFRAKQAEIVAVVLDMGMPRMDGRATYLALRAIDPSVAVLLTTGYALNEEAQAILDLGVRGFIAKPCDVEALSHALARVIGEKRRLA